MRIETFEVIIPEITEEFFNVVCNLGFVVLRLVTSRFFSVGKVSRETHIHDAEAFGNCPVDVWSDWVSGDSIVGCDFTSVRIGGCEEFRTGSVSIGRFE